MLKLCCRNLFKIADLFCYLGSSFNRTMCQRLASSRLDCYQLQWIHWPPNSPDLNPLDYHVRGARPVLECYKSFQLKPEKIDAFKKVLQLIWEKLPQDQQSHIELPKKTSGLCESWWWGHFKYMLKWTTCQILVFVITVIVSWQWKLQVAVDYSVQNSKYDIEYLYSHNFREK